MSHRMEIAYTIGPPCVIVDVHTEADSAGYEAIRSSVAGYQCVVDAEWLTAEGHKLLVTLKHEGRGDEYMRLGYFMRQLGVRIPVT